MMSSIEAILTHPGSAHKDEFLACCVLLAENPVPIVRREPTAEDLLNPKLGVVDVGQLHDPAKNNFDHHQLPRDHAPTCSLSLVLQHLGLYEDALQFCEWLEPAEWFDCRGPVTTAKWLGLSRDLIPKLHSPIDITLLRRFSMESRLDPGHPLWEVMRMIGADILNYVRTLRMRLDELGHQVQWWDLELAGVPAKILFLPRTDPLPDDPSMGLDQFIVRQGLTDQVVGVVTPDRRNTGYSLSRYRDNARLDFTKIKDCPDVHFAHASGFVAKTTAIEPDRLKELLKKAGVEQD